jgi:DNA repair protein RAD5
MEEPPTKKRRFFEESSEVPDATFIQEASLPDEVDAFSSSPPPNREVQQNEASDGSSHNDLPRRPEPVRNDRPVFGFDQGTFESIVCDKVAPDVMKRLREASGDNMERAVNMYFDGSWKTTAAPSRNNSDSRTLTINDFARSTPSGNGKQSPAARVESPKIRLKESMPEYRYVGAFGVDGWATRSGTALIKYGETVHIERQKIQPPKAPVNGKGRPAAAQQPPKPNSAAAKRVDVIVRFTNARYVFPKHMS